MAGLRDGGASNLAAALEAGRSLSGAARPTLMKRPPTERFAVRYVQAARKEKAPALQGRGVLTAGAEGELQHQGEGNGKMPDYSQETGSNLGPPSSPLAVCTS